MECLQCKASTSLEWKCTRMFMVEYVRACISQQFLHRNFVVCCVNIFVWYWFAVSFQKVIFRDLSSISHCLVHPLKLHSNWVNERVEKLTCLHSRIDGENLHKIQHLSKDIVQQLASWRTCLIVEEDRMHSFVKNHFKLMDIFWTFLLLVALSDPSFAVLIEMERLPSFPTDDFLLSGSLCPSSRPSCSLFRAHPLGGCWCSCPNTFSFYEEDFQCERNSEARRNAGIFCDLRLF